jgi:hypothetical protein
LGISPSNMGLNHEKWEVIQPMIETDRTQQRENPLFDESIPSGKLTVCYRKSPFVKGKSSINGDSP